MRPAGACGHEATDLRSVVPAPIRVLMITSGYPQPGQPHTQQFVKRQAEFLRVAGVEVEVFDFRRRPKLRHYVTGWTRVRSRLRAGRYDLLHAQFGARGLLALRKRFPLAQRAMELLNQSLPAELIVGWGVLHTDMPYYMNACDALVFTSVQEGSPNAVKEALACNLPVVSVAVGDVPLRLHGVAECEVCADDRPETIAAGLERVLRSGRRSNGRDALKDLDEASLTAKVIDVYRSVLTNSPRR